MSGEKLYDQIASTSEIKNKKNYLKREAKE